MSAPGGIKRHIPNLLTLVNLCCGFLAIHFVFQQEWVIVIGILMLGGFADIFDGLAARALNVQNPIGGQLDSLADMVSFGIVPGLIISTLYYELNGPDLAIENPFLDMKKLQSWILGFFIIGAAALRLAKFNTLESDSQSGDFIGLATPAMTGLVASFLLVKDDVPYLSLVLVFMSIFCARLMVTNVTFFSLKFKGKGWKGNELRYIFIVLMVIFLVVLREKGLFALMFTYIVVNVIIHYYKKIVS